MGYVKVFAWNGSSWEMKGSRLNGENEEDHFGTSITLSSDGNTLAVYDRQGINGESAGTVVVYSWNGTDWTQKGNKLEGMREIILDGPLVYQLMVIQLL